MGNPDKPTDKQLAYLIKLGVHDIPRSRQEASDWIDQAKEVLEDTFGGDDDEYFGT